MYAFARNAIGFIDPIGLYAMIFPLLPEIGAGAVAAGKAVLGVIGVVTVASSLSSDTANTQTKTGNCSGSKCNNNNSCKVKYATVPLCDDLAKQGYIFNSLNQLFNHYRMQARKHSEAIATKGPCRGQGKHINLRSKDNGSVKVGTAASCNCCKDDAAGNAQLKTVFAKLN